MFWEPQVVSIKVKLEVCMSSTSGVKVAVKK